MNRAGTLVQPMLAALMLTLMASCGKSNPVQPTPPASSVTPAPTDAATCDCSTFPPKKGCETQCGITTGVVESVTESAVVIRVPSIKKSVVDGKETTQVVDRTFSIPRDEASQLQSIQPGSRVALTFQKNDNALKSIRELPKEP